MRNFCGFGGVKYEKSNPLHCHKPRWLHCRPAGDDLSFLSAVAKEGEDYGYQAFTARVDIVIMGRKTYDWVLQHADFPHQDKTTYIITRSQRPSVGNTQVSN